MQQGAQEGFPGGAGGGVVTGEKGRGSGCRTDRQGLAGGEGGELCTQNMIVACLKTSANLHNNKQ